MKKITNISSGSIKILVKQGVTFDIASNSFIYSEEPNLTPTIRVYAKKNLLKVEDIEKPSHLDALKVYSPIDMPSWAELMTCQARMILDEDEEFLNLKPGQEIKLEEDDFGYGPQDNLDNILDGLEQDDFGIILKECQKETSSIIDKEIIKTLKGEPSDLVIIEPENLIVEIDGSIVESNDIIIEPPIKNKGGRPKGAKNKPKSSRRGRQKKRGPKKGSKNKRRVNG